MKPWIALACVFVGLVPVLACSSGSGGGGGGGNGGDGGGGSSSGGSSGGGLGGTGVAFCNVPAMKECYVFQNGAPETAGGDGVKCSAELGGTASSGCPTTGLLGCCVYSSPMDYLCYYQGSGVQGCSGGSGVGNWSTTTLP